MNKRVIRYGFRGAPIIDSIHCQHVSGQRNHQRGISLLQKSEFLSWPSLYSLIKDSTRVVKVVYSGKYGGFLLKDEASLLRSFAALTLLSVLNVLSQKLYGDLFYLQSKSPPLQTETKMSSNDDYNNVLINFRALKESR